MIMRALATAIVCGALLTATGSSVRARQKPASTQDDAVLRGYRLTPAILQKVGAAAHAFAQAMQNDPKYKSAMAAGRELQALQDKENRTEAEDQRIDTLEKQVDAAQKEFEALAPSNDSDDSQTIADAARKIASIPHMSDALAGAGLTPRDFATFEMAMMQAGLAAGFRKAGLVKQMPPGAPPENVQFMLDHESELQQIQKDLSGGSI
jgi:hypothetical protein